MNFEPPQPPTPGDEMEARLTALLLGELSAEEEGTLRAALAQDAALAQLHDRLAVTIGLVREAAGSLREEATPPAEALQLSAARREKLLQTFKVIRPKELQRAKRRPVNWREWAAEAAMGMGLLAVAGVVVSNQQLGLIRLGENESDDEGFSVGRVLEYFDSESRGPERTTTIPGRAFALSGGGQLDGALAGKKDSLDPREVTHFFSDPGSDSESEALGLDTAGLRPTTPAPVNFSAALYDTAEIQPPPTTAPSTPPSAALPTSSTTSESLVAAASTRPPGRQIVLPALAQVTDGRVDRLHDFDSYQIDLAKAPARSANGPGSQPQNFGAIVDSFGNQSSFGRGGGGWAGGMGGVAGGNFFAQSLSEAVAKDAPVVTDPRPVLRFSEGFKAEAKLADDALTWFSDTSGPLNQNRELQERSSQRGSLVVADNNHWSFNGSGPTPVPARPLSAITASGPVAADDFRTTEAARTQALTEDRAVLSRSDYLTTVTVTPAPAPAAGRPMQPVDKQLADVSEVDASQPQEAKLAYAGKPISGTVAAQNALSSATPAAVDQEGRSSFASQLNRFTSRATGAAFDNSQFNAPAEVAKAEAQVPQRSTAGDGVERFYRSRISGATDAGQKVADGELTDLYITKAKGLRSEVMLAEAHDVKSQDEFTLGKSVVITSREKTKANEPALGLSDGRRKQFAIALPEEPKAERDLKRESQSADGSAVEGHEVVLSAADKATEPDRVRNFKADTQIFAFARDLNAVTALNFAKSAAQSQGGGGVRATGGLTTNSTLPISELARQYFATAGVSLKTNSGGQSAPITFDDRTGVLTVRASSRDLDIIAQALQLLGVEDISATPSPAPTAPVPQPEVSTADNAFSTFSLNVSDVSFKLAAAALEKGQMPDPATVRSEEFINAFDYRDPEPKGSAPVAFAWERARYPFAHNRDLLRFSIKTAATGRQPGRPLNLVLLLDNSGSMERADRVRIIQECLRVLASQLQPQDRVSVVAFARTPRLWVDGLPGNQAGELGQRVGGLTPQGGTNLEDAMNLAYQTAARHFLANGVNRVVLLTDGAANLGDVEPASLKKKVEAQRQQGIALDCFGIGWEGFNDELLESLSRNGDGRYGFVNSPEAAATEFAGQLAGALQVAASDVKVQVEFNPRRVTSHRQIGYAKHQLKKEQFRDNTVDAAEIAAAEAGNALYTVEVNPAGEGPLATVRVRFKIPGSHDYREHEWAVPYDGAAKSLEQSTAPLRLAGTASAFSEWLVASPFAGEVTPDRLLTLISGVPETFAADPRPKKLEWMLRQAKSVAGK